MGMDTWNLWWGWWTQFTGLAVAMFSRGHSESIHKQVSIAQGLGCVMIGAELSLTTPVLDCDHSFWL